MAGEVDNNSYVLQKYVEALLLTNQQHRALDNLEALMARNYQIKPGWLRNDPAYRPLAGNPRFERLANRGIGAPVD